MVKIVGANVDLHMHSFMPQKESVNLVLNTMRRNKLDIVAPSFLDKSVYSFYRNYAHHANQINDNYGIIFQPLRNFDTDTTKIIFNARENSTAENLHLLTIGYSADVEDYRNDLPIRDRIDEALEHDALVIIAHPYSDFVHSCNAGHIDKELEGKLEELCKEYSEEIAVEWNSYCNPRIRWISRLAMNSPLHLFNPKKEKNRYHHVNKKAEVLSNKLSERGYNVPLIANSDVHAKKPKMMKAIGAARFVVDVEGSTPYELFKDMKEKIFSGEYKNRKGHANAIHLSNALIIPKVKKEIKKKFHR